MLYGLSFDARVSLVVTENDLTARTLSEDLSFFDPSVKVYPARDLLFL